MNKWFAGCGNVKLFELHQNRRVEYNVWKNLGQYEWRILPIYGMEYLTEFLPYFCKISTKASYTMKNMSYTI